MFDFLRALFNGGLSTDSVAFEAPPETLRRMDEIRCWSGIPTRGKILGRAVGLFYYLAYQEYMGATIVVKKDGKEKIIKVIS